ncbi:MAG: SCP2 sterol-binding domain-containing protein, partial [Phenylobacterium sp.]
MNFKDLEAVGAGNPGLASRFRFSDLTVVLDAEGQASTLRVKDGAFSVADGAAPDADFTLSATAADWAGFVSEAPPVGLQTLYGMSTVDRLQLTGPRMTQF